MTDSTHPSVAGPADEGLRRVTADHLHRAADVVGKTQDPSDLGFKDGAIERFIAETDWRPEGGGSELALDSLAMAMGISIGLVTAREAALDAAAGCLPEGGGKP